MGKTKEIVPASYHFQVVDAIRDNKASRPVRVETPLAGASNREIHRLALMETERRMRVKYPDGMAFRVGYHYRESRWTGNREECGSYQIPLPGVYEEEFKALLPVVEKDLIEKRAAEDTFVREEIPAEVSSDEDAVISVVRKIHEVSTKEVCVSLGYLRDQIDLYERIKTCRVATPLLDEMEDFLAEGDYEYTQILRKDLVMTTEYFLKYVDFPKNREKYKKKFWQALGWE